MANLNKKIKELSGSDKLFKTDSGTTTMTLGKWTCNALLGNDPSLTPTQKAANYALALKIHGTGVSESDTTLTEGEKAIILARVISGSAPLIAGQIMEEIG